MDPESFAPFGALRVLLGNDVRFVVIGGIAGQLHGSTSMTFDIDVCYERSRDNAERMAVALKEMNARPRGFPDDLVFVLDADTIRLGDSFTFVTDHGEVDCLGTPSGTMGFDELERNAVTMDVGGLRLPVCSLNDLMRMKRAAGRPKDRIELEILGALRDEIEEAESERRPR
ncbi:MAG: hypothetical protein GEU28_03605 [Dehalococcoidia bacterium]|nr:hypothetical protein [Dehalococcoidia bacterium]